MKVWRYIGEFFLFKRLFGNGKRSDSSFDSYKRDDMRHNPVDYVENDDDLDDLDIFMRENSGNKHGSRYSGDYESGFGKGYNRGGADCGSFDQSTEDFHEEQDDYDMLDDF